MMLLFEIYNDAAACSADSPGNPHTAFQAECSLAKPLLLCGVRVALLEALIRSSDWLLLEMAGTRCHRRVHRLLP